MTTAYPEYALDGYEHDVVDYLLKPIAFDRFLKAAQKAFTILGHDKPLLSQTAVVNETPPVNAQDYMFIKGESKNKFLKVDYGDILYIE